MFLTPLVVRAAPFALVEEPLDFQKKLRTLPLCGGCHNHHGAWIEVARWRALMAATVDLPHCREPFEMLCLATFQQVDLAGVGLES